jgi:hypothetical protein
MLAWRRTSATVLQAISNLGVNGFCELTSGDRIRRMAMIENVVARIAPNLLTASDMETVEVEDKPKPPVMTVSLVA